MYENFFNSRLSKLRIKKGVSQREMSLSMGQSEGYMTKIENGTSFPSMTVFFYICEYLGVHPKDFFDEELDNPKIIREINNDLKRLNPNQLIHLAAIIKDLK